MMMLLIQVLLWTLVAAVALPAMVFVAECALALLPGRKVAGLREAPRPSVAVLIPAHNEDVVIEETLASVMAQTRPGDRVLVVADNCDDRTAELARRRGAEVAERQDAARPGKGYAMDFGLRALAGRPPEVVVFVDADCTLGAGTLDTLARAAAATQGPVQAAYLMHPPTRAGAKDRISAFAFLVKNLVRLRGLGRIGMPSHVTGSGMAVPWSALGKISLAHGEIEEEIRMGLDLLLAGHPVRFVEEAVVLGRLPEARSIAAAQRKRWEHGRLLTLLHRVPGLLAIAARRGSVRIAAIAMDLCVPPVALLMLVWFGVTGVAVIAAIAGVTGPAIASALLGVALMAAVLLAWARWGRALLPPRALLAVPFYLLWKVPIYVLFLVKPHRAWNRTQREPARAS